MRTEKPHRCPDCARRFKTDEGMQQHARDVHGRVGEVVPTPVKQDVDPVCIECGGTASLVRGDRIYPHRPDLFHKLFWLCSCGAYCGCHGITERPLGNPCGPATRAARMAAHAAFDPLWKSKRMGRREAYTWLSSVMGMLPENTHIGMMTEAQARAVVEHCRARRRA